ncbi:hypothetical protein KC842_02195 [Candidatus Nomurabacteria bacterium]|nr:hypothetical protein [Candidatus Nomurabacteria bacterium]USN94979.1 MAG: hypothetical protein H6791_00935 [Candidatus Nomurabacteria bacterium]
MLSKNVKLVIFSPINSSDGIRKVLGELGAGIIGNYDFCSFSSIGTGRFRGNKESNPAIGKAEVLEEVQEERIEVIVSREIIKKVVEEVKKVHPYEEMAYDIYSLEDLD